MKFRASFTPWISLGLMNCSNGPAIEATVVKNETFLNANAEKEKTLKTVPIFVQSVQYDTERNLMLIEFHVVREEDSPALLLCDLNCPENFQISQTDFKASWPVLGKKSLDQKFVMKATSGDVVSTREFSFQIPWVEKPSIPVDYSALKPENIKSGLTIGGVTGILEARPKECDANAEVGCVATSAYKAADFTNLTAEKIKTGKVVAGVTGLFPSVLVPLGGASGTDLPNLSASVAAGTYQWWKQDGTRLTGSISDASTISPTNAVQNFQASVYRQFTVATDANLSAANIKSGASIFGVSGSVAIRPTDCSTNAEVGCVTTSSYKAGDLTTVTADKIKAGVIAAGVTGQYPSVLYPLQNASGTDLPSLNASVAAGTYQWWKQDGTRLSGSINDAGTITPSASTQSFNASVYRQFTVSTDANLVATNIKSGASIFGVTGSVAVKPADCAANAAVGCVTTSSYKAADLTNLTDSNIKTGIVAAGVSGLFPSVLYPLTGASGNDLPNLNATVAAGTYQWWKQDGTRATGNIADASTITPTTTAQTFNTSVYRQFTVATDANLAAANIKSGASVFGVAGSVTASPGACNADNQSGCVSSASFPSSNPAAIAATDLLSGKQIGGVTGSIAACAASGSASCLANASYPAKKAATTLLTDLFAGSSVDTAKWTETPLGGAAQGVVQNGALEIPLNANCATTCWLKVPSTIKYNFTGAAFSAEITQIVSSIKLEMMTITIKYYDDSETIKYKYEVAFYNGNLSFDYRNVGTGAAAVSVVSVPYNAVNHRYWRIRHDAVTGNMLGEVSADGTTWSVLGATPLSGSYDLTKTRVELNAGIWENSVTPSTPKFDNVYVKTFF